MAKAPRPGVAERQEAEAEAQTILTITLKPEVVTKKGNTLPHEHTLAISSVPISEKLVCRRSTGLPLESFWAGEGTVGEDSLVVLWWLARRAASERGLNFTDAADEWPENLAADDVEVEVNEPDPEATDPEA